jgi:hypothetical protein
MVVKRKKGNKRTSQPDISKVLKINLHDCWTSWLDISGYFYLMQLELLS